MVVAFRSGRRRSFGSLTLAQDDRKQVVRFSGATRINGPFAQDDRKQRFSRAMWGCRHAEAARKADVARKREQ